MNLLLLLGASVRAAAQSAARAGYQPHGIDLFADRDLTALGPCQLISRDAYPEGFESLARSAPDGPWLYTGGLENHPEMIDRLARTRLLWGNHGEQLRRVRDPFEVAAILQRGAALSWGAVVHRESAT